MDHKRMKSGFKSLRLPEFLKGFWSQSQISSFWLVRGTWLIHTWDMTHSYAHPYVHRYSFICVTWYMGQIARMNAIRLVHMWDVTQSCVGHDRFICAPWLVHMCDMMSGSCRPNKCDMIVSCAGPWRPWAIMSHSFHVQGVVHVRDSCTLCLIHVWHLKHALHMKHVLHMKQSCPIHVGITDKHVTFLIHTCVADFQQPMGHDTRMNETYGTWFVHMCDMTHSYLWHDLFICVTWFIHKCDMTHSYVWHGSFIRVTWLIHMCDMTHSHVWHDSSIRDMTHWHVWHHSFICVTWLTYMCDNMCDMTHSYVV